MHQQHFKRSQQHTCIPVGYNSLLTSLQKHLVHLKKVFERLTKTNFKIQLDKCVLLKKQVALLGHIVTPQPVKPKLDKIKAISQYQRKQRKLKDSSVYQVTTENSITPKKLLNIKCLETCKRHVFIYLSNNDETKLNQDNGFQGVQVCKCKKEQRSF